MKLFHLMKHKLININLMQDVVIDIINPRGGGLIIH